MAHRKFYLVLAGLVAGATLLPGCTDKKPGRPATETPMSSPTAREHADAHDHAAGNALAHDDDDHGHGGDAAGMKARVDRVAGYPEAIDHIEHLQSEIAAFVKSDKLLDVHPAAEELFGNTPRERTATSASDPLCRPGRTSLWSWLFSRDPASGKLRHRRSP